MSFSTSGDVAANRDDWNATLEALDGHLLQSWQWGSFRERYGWHAERIVWPDFGTPRAMAQVLFRSRGPVSIGYIPRGPAFAPGDIEAVSELLKLVDEAAKRHRALYLMIEANSALPFSGTFRDHGFVKGVASIQPERKAISSGQATFRPWRFSSVAMNCPASIRLSWVPVSSQA